MDTKRCNNHEILLREKELYHVKISLLQRVFSRNSPPQTKEKLQLSRYNILEEELGYKQWIQNKLPIV